MNKLNKIFPGGIATEFGSCSSQFLKPRYKQLQSLSQFGKPKMMLAIVDGKLGTRSWADQSGNGRDCSKLPKTGIGLAIAKRIKDSWYQRKL